MRGGSINGEERFDGIVCPTCFVVLAEDAGVASRWRVWPEVVHVPLETVTPSGRVWNPQTWRFERGTPFAMILRAAPRRTLTGMRRAATIAGTALAALLLSATAALASPEPPTNGGNGGGHSGVCTGNPADRPAVCPGT